MLSTGLFWFLAFFTGFNLLILAIFAYRIVSALRSTHSLAEYVRNQNKNAVSLRRMAELSAEVTDLRDAYEAILESHKKLRARIGMRATREKRNGAEIPIESTAPADETERLAYKNRLRAKLRKEGRL